MHKSAFIFDDVTIAPDRQIGMHTHQCWELSHIIRGSGKRIIGDRTEPIQKDEIILIPPGIPHVWMFDSDKTDHDGKIANITVLFDATLPDRLSSVLPELSPSLQKLNTRTDAISYSGAAHTAIRSLLHSMRGLDAQARLPMMIKLLTAVGDTEGCRTVGHRNTINRIQKRLEQVRVYCACNYARHIKLDEIAAYTGMNKSAFCTFMRRRAGMSLSEYVNTMRLEKACERIRNSEENIATIAYDVGFSNVSYFNRIFRARYGRTPGSLRNGNQQ